MGPKRLFRCRHPSNTDLGVMVRVPKTAVSLQTSLKYGLGPEGAGAQNGGFAADIHQKWHGEGCSEQHSRHLQPMGGYVATELLPRTPRSVVNEPLRKISSIKGVGGMGEAPLNNKKASLIQILKPRTIIPPSIKTNRRIWGSPNWRLAA